MVNAIEQAKVDVAELIRIEAEKKDIQLLRTEWLINYPVTHWDAAVTASNGRTAFQKFYPKQLVGFRNDNRLKMQVHAKVASIIAQLKE